MKLTLLLTLIALLFVACRGGRNDPPVVPNDELLEPVPVPTFELQSVNLPDWVAGDNVTVEVLGTGIGNRYTASSTATITIPDPSTVQALYAQVVLKGGALYPGGPEYTAPNNVTVSSSVETKSLSGGELSLTLPTDADGLGLDNIARIYEGTFAPASSLTVDIDHIGWTNRRTPRAFIVYVLRTAQDDVSVGSVPNHYLYGEQGYVSATRTVTIPTSSDPQDIDVTFAISELSSVRNTAGDPDTKNVKLSIEAGGVTKTSTFEFPDKNDELLIATLTLADVPAGTTEVKATVISEALPPGGNPQDYGDAVFWNGLEVSAASSGNTGGGDTGGGDTGGGDTGGGDTGGSNLDATLPDWVTSDNVNVDVLGTGLGNRYSASSTATITIPDPSSVQALYAQVVFKGGALYPGGPTFVAPTDVTVASSVETKSLSGGELSLALPTDETGTEVDNIARIYEGTFAPANSLTVSINDIGRTNRRTPRAFIVYVLRDSQDDVSVGGVPNHYLFGQQGYASASKTVTIPNSNDPQDIEVTFAISELS
ncbi:MAG: hypothetical protein AAF708_00465, partial [Deinococcota bacterium]